MSDTALYLDNLHEWEAAFNPNRDTTFDESEPNWPACHPPLPAPWRMSIEALDSWNDFYRTRLRGLGPGCGALTATETAHRAEVEANINARHEARRHSAFSR
jgi:hypothetical protein